jgi:hypothetical protein
MRASRTLPGLLLSIALAGCATTGPDGAPEPPAPTELSRFSGAKADGVLPGDWKLWTFSRLKKKTDYALVEDDGRICIRARSEGAASGLRHRLDLDPLRYPLLTWRWKVPQLIASADNTSRHKEDSPVRIMVSFEGDIDRLPLDDRMFFDKARIFGQELPYATIMYIWENRAPVGTVIRNAHTTRIQMIVAASGPTRLGEWKTFERNVVEDYRRAFGEEPGRVTAVAIMTDTDNTGEQTVAYYGDIAFRPRRATAAADPR